VKSYRIFETEEFQHALERLGPQVPARIEAKLPSHVYPQLRKEPHFGINIKKLRGYDPDTWRYRIGDFRVLFGIREVDRVVSILTIENRKDVYKK